MSDEAERDCAWVKVQLPLEPAVVAAFLGDLERLFRLNPYLDLSRAKTEPDGVVQLTGRNESNDQPVDVQVRLAASEPRHLSVCYSNGIKRETHFDLTPSAGTLLTITEVYEPADPDRRDERMKLLDRSLVPWAAALRRHLLLRRRWGWIPGFLPFLDRWWLGMSPRQRRIAWLITWTTAVEFLVFLVAIAILAR